MTKYKDLCGRSPITEYENGYGYIRVRFGKAKSGMDPHRTYQWSANDIGDEAIAEMQELAEYGCGLAKYIFDNVERKVNRVF